MKARRWGSGDAAGSSVRILAENTPHAEGALLRLTQPPAPLGGDLRDHLGDARPGGYSGGTFRGGGANGAAGDFDERAVGEQVAQRAGHAL